MNLKTILDFFMSPPLWLKAAYYNLVLYAGLVAFLSLVVFLPGEIIFGATVFVLLAFIWYATWDFLKFDAKWHKDRD